MSRPRKDPNAPDPERIGIERLQERMSKELGIPMSNAAVHNAINELGLPCYVDPFHKTNKGEPRFLFVFAEVEAWAKGRIVRYVPPPKPSAKIPTFQPMRKAR